MKSAHTKTIPTQCIYINNASQDCGPRSNSSFDQAKNVRPVQPVYKGVLGFSKSKDLPAKAIVGAFPFSKAQSYKLPHIQQTAAGKGLGSPHQFNPREMFKVNNGLPSEQRDLAVYAGQAFQGVSLQGECKKISQSNSSNNVASQYVSPQKANPLRREMRGQSGSYLSEEKYNKTEKNVQVFESEFEYGEQVGITAMLVGGALGAEEIDDEEDFGERKGRGKEPQYLDQLGEYQEEDEGLEEDDEVLGGGLDENLELEEEVGEREDEEDSRTVCTGMTESQSAITKKSAITSQNGDKPKASKSKRKVTMKRRKTVQKRSDVKMGYYEGAEEQKTQSFGDSQTTFSVEPVKPSSSSKPSQINLPSTPDLYPTQDLQPKPKVKFDLLKRPPNNTITVLKSAFGGRRPGTVFFPYPVFLKMQREAPEGGLQRFSQQELMPYQTLTFKINSSTHTYNCVVNALKTAGFRLISGGSQWNLLWTGVMKPNRLKQVNQFQKINHFPGCWFLGRKDNLWRNVFRMKRAHGAEYNICPQTYIFPEDYKRFCMDRELSNYKNLYIMKPSASSCGRGIKMIGKKSHVNKRSGYLVSKYVNKPHLINGFKYDLRIYVVVTCFEPLKVYLFQEGLVRLATQQYSVGKSNLSKRFVHLTNFSVNKKASNYVPNRADEGNSSKWSFGQLREEFGKQGVDYEQVFEGIKDVIIKTLLSVEPHIVTNMKQSKHRGVCFELYGFDIILDHKLKPWLLEVNVCPSLSSSSPFDKRVKTTLLCDLLHMVGFQVFDRKKHERDQERVNKQRLLGFEPQKKKLADHGSPTQSIGSPLKRGSYSPEKISAFRQGKYNQQTIEFIEGLCDQDWEILADFEEEHSRRGHFSRIFPTAGNVDRYAKFFELSRHANQLVWQYLRLGAPAHILKQHFK